METRRKFRVSRAAVVARRPPDASHASTRTTQLYDRRADELSLDEVKRIGM